MQITKEFLIDTVAKAKRILETPKEGIQQDILEQVAKTIECENERGCPTGVSYNQSKWFEPNITDRNMCGSTACLAGEICLTKFTPQELAIFGNHFSSVIPSNLRTFYNHLLCVNNFSSHGEFVYTNSNSLIADLAKSIAGTPDWVTTVIFNNGGYGYWPTRLRDMVDDGNKNKAAAELLRCIVSGKIVKQYGTSYLKEII